MSLLWIHAGRFPVPRESFDGEPVHEHGRYSIIGHDTRDPMPSQDEIRRGDAYRIYEHRLHHPETGEVMGKMVYQTYPKNPKYLEVNAMAVKRKFAGTGLAQRLHLELQRQAQAQGHTIYHGERTTSGHEAWQRFTKHPEFDPSVHDETGYEGPSKDIKEDYIREKMFGRGASLVPEEDNEWEHHYTGGFPQE